jgi:tellurite methyltransferase
MSIQDAVRWNHRYQTRDRSVAPSPRAFLVEHADLLPRDGRALDVAMGLGGNAAFLVARGLNVVGVDLSEVAAREAKARWPDLHVALADLPHLGLPRAAFDVIINFYFLDRGLWPIYRRALRPGGVLIIETLTQDILSLHPDIDPAHLLKPGELRAAFQDWDIVTYREEWIDQEGWHRAVASLVARRP